MDDINENQFDNQDDFEFEKYPEEDNKDIISDEKAVSDKNAEDGVFVPVIPVEGDGGSNNSDEKTEEDKEEKRLDEEQEKEDNSLNMVPVMPISPQERARRAARREKLKEEQRRKEEEKAKRRKNMKITLIVFGILLFVMWLIYYALTNMMPEHLMNQGKKYLEIQEYNKALKMFKMAADSKPYDEDPVYYQAVTLSKMPPTYENQKALYEISQLDNYDKASEFADKVLLSMKKQIDKKVGSNYVDNVLYDDILFRWNTSQPVTYYISNNNSSSQEYLNALRKAFGNWSTATNGELVFKEIMSSGNADIIVSFLNDLSMPNSFDDPNRSGVVYPVIKDSNLQKVNIGLRTSYPNGAKYDVNAFKVVAQHEIGHAIGIWGHSSNPNDIMHYSGDYIAGVNGSKSFTKRDINTVSLLYKMMPDVINKPIDSKDYDMYFYHYVITTVPGEDFEYEMQRLLSNLSNDTRNIVGWVELAINYGIKKQYKRSNTILNRILPLTKNDIQNQFVVLYNMAANSYKMKQYKQTEQLLKLATMYHEDVDTQMLEAFTDLKLKRTELGKSKLILLNETYPDNIEVALKLAQVYYFGRERAKAKEVIDNLLKVNPEAILDRRVAKYRAYNAKHAEKSKEPEVITVK